MQELIQLTEDLLTGMPEMDAQHRTLVDLINETYKSLREGNREAAREKFMNGVGAYVNFHLRSEEEFLRRIEFPDYELHKQIHANFEKQVLKWVEEAKQGDERILRQVNALVWAWFLRHIAVKDKAYGEYYRQHAQPH
ncbi:MAG: hemerythrin family protein [Anaerolineae bacterium]|nr:hemerythrin family protein [Anaerolineae bacterium]